MPDCHVMFEIFISKIDLIVSIIGCLLVAYSIGKNPDDVKNTEGVYVVSFLHPKIFRIGIILIVGGFSLAIFDTETISQIAKKIYENQY